MKKKKCWLSCILAAALIAGVLPGISMHTEAGGQDAVVTGGIGATLAGWTLNADAGENFGTLCREISSDGDGSCLQFANANGGGNEYRMAPYLGAGTYTISYDVKGMPGSTGYFQLLLQGTIGYNWDDMTCYEITDAEWKHMEKIITVAEGLNIQKLAAYSRLSGGCYFDNLSVKDADGREYVYNGGFYSEGNLDYFGGVDADYTAAVRGQGADRDLGYLCLSPDGFSQMEGTTNIVSFFTNQTLKQETEYTLSFEMTTASLDGRVEFELQGQPLSVFNCSGNDGWVSKSIKFTPNEERDYMYVYTPSWKANEEVVYIKNLSVKDNMGNEYVKNGTFLSFAEQEDMIAVGRIGATLAGWTLNGDAGENFGTLCKGISSDGDGSCLQFANANGQGNEYRMAPYLGAGTYTISYDVKGMPGSTGHFQLLLQGTIGYDWDGMNCYEITDAEWKHMEKTVTVAEGLNIQKLAAYSRLSGGCYFDNLSVKDADGREYVYNGGFYSEGNLDHFGGVDADYTAAVRGQGADRNLGYLCLSPDGFSQMEGNTNIVAFFTNQTLKPETEYTLSFEMAAASADGRVEFELQGQPLSTFNCSGNEGWVSKSIKFTPNEEGEYMYVYTPSWKANGEVVYIKNLSVKDHAGNEYVKNTDFLKPAQKIEYYEDISSYRNTEKTAPKKDGYLFAGWYQDTACTIPVSAETTEGQAYAKFVDEDVMKVYAQIKSGTNDNAKDIRFITTVDGADYQKVGFKIRIGEGEISTKEINTVYRQLYASRNSTQVDTVTPFSVCSPISQYFTTYSYWNVPEENYSTEFHITPYWITHDGTTVYGMEITKTINMGLLL